MDYDKRDLPPKSMSVERRVTERQPSPPHFHAGRDLTFPTTTEAGLVDNKNTYLHPNVSTHLETISAPTNSATVVIQAMQFLYGRDKDPLMAPSFKEIQQSVESGIELRRLANETEVRKCLSERFIGPQGNVLIEIAMRARSSTEFVDKLNSEPWYKRRKDKE